MEAIAPTTAGIAPATAPDATTSGGAVSPSADASQTGAVATTCQLSSQASHTEINELFASFNNNIGATDLMKALLAALLLGSNDKDKQDDPTKMLAALLLMAGGGQGGTSLFYSSETTVQVSESAGTANAQQQAGDAYGGSAGAQTAPTAAVDAVA